jgi:hypothetical protein
MLQKEQRTSIELNADHCVAISLWRSDITRQSKCHDLAPPKADDRDWQVGVVGSTGRRNTSLKSFCWRFVV